MGVGGSGRFGGGHLRAPRPTAARRAILSHSAAHVIETRRTKAYVPLPLAETFRVVRPEAVRTRRRDGRVGLTLGRARSFAGAFVAPFLAAGAGAAAFASGFQRASRS